MKIDLTVNLNVRYPGSLSGDLANPKKKRIADVDPRLKPRGVHTPNHVKDDALESLRRIFRESLVESHSGADIAAVVYEERGRLGPRMVLQ